MLDVVPPFVPVLVAAAVAAVAPRTVGHAVGVVATAGVAVVSLLAPAGTHLPTALFGFDAVLYQVDEFSRMMGVIFGLIGAAAVRYAHSSEADGTMSPKMTLIIRENSSTWYSTASKPNSAVGR